MAAVTSRANQQLYIDSKFFNTLLIEYDKVYY